MSTSSDGQAKKPRKIVDGNVTIDPGSAPSQALVPLSTDGKNNVQARKSATPRAMQRKTLEEKTGNSDPQPFTILEKNVESVKRNGTTTCKSKFVIRGKRPLSSEQLESLIKDNLLNTGSIKDGAKFLIRYTGGSSLPGVPAGLRIGEKFLIRYKGGAALPGRPAGLKSSQPSNKLSTRKKQKQTSPSPVKDEALVVKKSQILPVATPGTSILKQSLEVAKVKLPSPPAKKTNNITLVPFQPRISKPFNLEKKIPLFSYPKGASLPELHRIIRRHQMKICRQIKVIERLKKEKKEMLNNLRPEQLSKVVKSFMPGFPGSFFSSQLNVHATGKHGHRWDDDTKVFALGMWHRSPSAFKLMERAFKMPSIKTLTKWVTSIPPEVDFFQKLTEIMSKPATEPGDPFDENEGANTVPFPANAVAKEQESQDHVNMEPREGEVEPESPHNEEGLYPDEEQMDIIEEDPSGVQIEEDCAINEKVCIDLCSDSGMHVVEKFVDSGDILIQELIVAAENSGHHVTLQT